MKVIDYFEVSVKYLVSENSATITMKAVKSEPNYLAMEEPKIKPDHFTFTTTDGESVILMSRKIKSIISMPIFRND